MANWNSKRNGLSDAKDTLARSLVKVCAPDAFGKCVDCGGTIKTVLDWRLHTHAKRTDTTPTQDEEITIGQLRLI